MQAAEGSSACAIGHLLWLTQRTKLSKGNPLSLDSNYQDNKQQCEDDDVAQRRLTVVKLEGHDT